MLLEETDDGGATVLRTDAVKTGRALIEISCAHSAATICAVIQCSTGRQLFSTHGTACIGQFTTSGLMSTVMV
ncbi:MAG TPA: hypothetical protein VH496_09175 [Mycobacterium sp.]|nr:hypothetical protein [Micromonosporaceae bacterium]